VTGGTLPAWKARLVARETIRLPQWDHRSTARTMNAPFTVRHTRSSASRSLLVDRKAYTRGQSDVVASLLEGLE
jgi:hypothetical protein